MIEICLRIFLMGLLATPLLVGAQNDVPSQFTNMGSIVNTRHNMSQSTELTNAGNSMNNFRNRYGQVCVSCHTPHGANTNTAAPLWNRVIGNATYTLYSSSTLTGVVSNPGGASLPCLSCHDGTQASDAILNMPGAGQYSATPNPGNFIPSPGQFRSNQHKGLAVNQIGSGTPTAGTGCLSCHNPDGGTGQPGDPTDFTAFLIGTDLRNDHPVGVAYPTINGTGTDWNTPGGSKGSVRFFDENNNGRMDKGDIRLFDRGAGHAVECASCHDPHGVPSAGTGSPFLPSFLRKPIAGSGVCLTCHAK